jgi:hypothetical protein
MRAIDADAISYESIDSSDTGRHEHYYGTGIIAVRKEDIDAMPTIQPKRGKWHYSDGKPATIGRSFGVICDQCGTESEYCTNFCGECGADMRTKETDCDYERAVELLEHDMLYEPTFNQDDGSM